MATSTAARRRAPGAAHPGTDRHARGLTGQLGFAAATITAALGVAYLGVMAGMTLAGAGFPPPEPYATVIGLITLLTAPTLVVLMAAVHTWAPAGRQALSLAAFGLTCIFATLTSINRYVQLTVVRQGVAAGQTDGLALFMPYTWPSIMLALELLAWGGFLGLALILAGTVVGGRGLGRAAGWVLAVSGGLCLLAGVGQALEQTWMVWLGLVGWGPGLTVAAGLLALIFRRAPVAG